MSWWAAIPQIIQGVQSLQSMKGQGQQPIQPIGMISSQKPVQPTMPGAQSTSLGGLAQTGSSIMGAIDRRKEAANSNPQDTLKQGLQAIDTYKSDDINTEFIRNKLYEAYQKSQTMG